MKTFTLWNTNIHSATKEEMLETIEKAIKDDKKEFLITPNPEIMLLAKDNPKLMEALQKTILNPVDGYGLAWAKHFMEDLPKINKSYIKLWYQIISSSLQMLFNPKPISNKFPIIGGSDWINIISKKASKAGWKIFLLGGSESVSEKVKKKLEHKYNSLKIVGTFIGYLPEKDKEATEIINKTKPNILFVALGSPKQELWIYKNLDKLNTNIAIGIGAGFDFIAGNQIDAPEIMKKRAIKWIWRLLMSPFEKKIGGSGFFNRLKRIYRATYVFTKEVAKTKFTLQ